MQPSVHCNGLHKDCRFVVLFAGFTTNARKLVCELIQKDAVSHRFWRRKIVNVEDVEEISLDCGWVEVQFAF